MTDHEPKYRLGTRGYGTHHAVLDLIEPGARILDVGSAGGYISALAHDQRGARPLAVEPDPAACEEARRRGVEVLEGTIEEVVARGELEQRGPFDHVLMADVLEHLIQPERLLAEVRGLLDHNGSVIVSLPNIAYVRARLRIVRGVWRYEPTGIFDETHLRFFTLTTARELLQACGLTIEQEIPIGPAGYALGRRGVAITRIRPQLLASQLVFRARATQDRSVDRAGRS